MEQYGSHSTCHEMVHVLQVNAYILRVLSSTRTGATGSLNSRHWRTHSLIVVCRVRPVDTVIDHKPREDL